MLHAVRTALRSFIAKHELLLRLESTWLYSASYQPRAPSIQFRAPIAKPMTEHNSAHRGCASYVRLVGWASVSHFWVFISRHND
jgi:hypothetical protein